jgi:metal-dependent amidase/aminoacylase/carboxypeptidase family protein
LILKEYIMSKTGDFKDAVRDEVDKISGSLRDISHWIYENPEYGCEEVEASRLLSGELEKHGFGLEKPFLGMPTSFKATYGGGSGGTRLAILGEYDALEGVGHGCGHNIIGTAAVGAGIALSKVMDRLRGELVVLGCPAEENRRGGPPGGGRVSGVRRSCALEGCLMMLTWL